jgi:hypothetical protein
VRSERRSVRDGAHVQNVSIVTFARRTFRRRWSC